MSFLAARDATRLCYHVTGEGASLVCLPGGPMQDAAYRCDRLVDDVEALRQHLDVDRMDLLAHSGGANLAVLYAARHPERLGRLVLVTPSTFAVGIDATSHPRGPGHPRRAGAAPGGGA